MFIYAQSERTDRVLAAIMETLLLSGILFWGYILSCILIILCSLRQGLGWPDLVFTVMMSLQSVLGSLTH